MSVASWAERYVDRFGFALTYMPHGTKAPKHEGWNRDENLLRTPQQVRQHFQRRGHRNDNIGVVLDPSGLASIDADNPDGARTVLAAEGVDLDTLIKQGATIFGRNPRIEYLTPGNVKLGRKKITWPPRREGEKPITVLELRAGSVHDVLPPSLHPDTGRAYVWNPPPRQGFRELPDEILRLWLEFDQFAHRARNLCPWAPPEPEPVQRPRVVRPLTGPSVIAEFNARHDVSEILEANGYKKAGKRRWKSPHGKNLAGVVVLPSGRVYCHHASDPLGDERAHDAFDVYTQLVHNGNMRAAVRTVAAALGMRASA